MIRRSLLRFYGTNRPHPQTSPPSPKLPRNSPRREPPKGSLHEAPPSTLQNAEALTKSVPFFKRFAMSTEEAIQVFSLTSIFAFSVFIWSHIIFQHFFSLEGTVGQSMLPTLYVGEEWVLIRKYYRKGRDVQIGDVVQALNPTSPKESVVKRVIGMPGDFVKSGEADGDAPMMQVPMGHCFIAGDNQKESRDSRNYGPIPLALIKGKVVAAIRPSLFNPFSNFRWIGNTLKPCEDDGL